MTSEAIQRWLERKIARRIAGCWAGALLVLLAGLFVLYLTFWLAYVVIFVGEDGVSAVIGLLSNRGFHLGHTWRLVISGLFLVALFIEWIRRSPSDLGSYEKIHASPGARALVPYFGISSLLFANPRASAAIIAEILYIGPRLVLGGTALAREAYRSRNLETAESARVLLLLASREKAVTYEELRTMLPNTDWTMLKNILARVPGVVFLEKGFGLTDDLRKQLCGSVSVN